MWSDFGGKREGLLETAEDTACREFSEETLGLWGGMGDLETRVLNSITSIKRKVLLALNSEERSEGCFVVKNGLYVNFVVPVEVSLSLSSTVRAAITLCALVCSTWIPYSSSWPAMRMTCSCPPIPPPARLRRAL